VNGPPEGEGDNLWTRLRRHKVVQWSIAALAPLITAIEI
jgi:hypothetical protein